MQLALAHPNAPLQPHLSIHQQLALLKRGVNNVSYRLCPQLVDNNGIPLMF
jgi:hypothetical protein